MGGFTVYDALIDNPSTINYIGNKINSKPFDWIKKLRVIFKNGELSNIGYYDGEGYFVLDDKSFFSYISPKKYKKYNYQEVLDIINNKQSVILILESKFDIQIGDEKITSVDVLYHVSKTINEEKILKIGLAPKNSVNKTIYDEIRKELLGDIEDEKISEDELSVLGITINEMNSLNIEYMRKDDKLLRSFGW